MSVVSVNSVCFNGNLSAYKRKEAKISINKTKNTPANACGGNDF